MFKVTQRIRVEWAHCDPAGIIYNPNYYIWMDGGTHGLLQAAGFDFIKMTRENGAFKGCPLVASNMEFRRPLRFGDVVTLGSQVKKFGNTSFVVAHEFSLDDDPEPIASGSEVRVWAHSNPESPDKFLAQAVPEDIRAMLAKDGVVDVSA